MSTAKELGVQVGDYVQFIAQKEPVDTELVSVMATALPNQASQELFFDSGLIQFGLIGKCTKIIEKSEGDVYKFNRIRDDNTLSELTIPISGNTNCIASITYKLA